MQNHYVYVCMFMFFQLGLSDIHLNFYTENVPVKVVASENDLIS